MFMKIWECNGLVIYQTRSDIMNDETIYSNLVDNLHLRFEYYSLRIELAKREKSRTDMIHYEAKLELIGDLLNGIELRDGKIIDLYPELIETMRKDMELE